MEARRTHVSRVCMLSAHDKCFGGYENPTRGWIHCDCPCHDSRPTLFGQEWEES